jgi:hypothetical protein
MPAAPLGVQPYHTTRRLHRLGLTVELVPEALDIVQAVGNDDRVAVEQSLHRRHLRGTCILLRPGSTIGGAGEAERLGGDVVYCEPCDSGVGRRGDSGGEVGGQLLAAVGFAGTRIAGYHQQLRIQRHDCTQDGFANSPAYFVSFRSVPLLAESGRPPQPVDCLPLRST